MLVRKATIEDLQQLLDIYNYEVVNGVATFDLQPKTIEEWKCWFYKHNVDNHPLYVAQIENHVAGYASFSSYREKEAYATTVELSVYVAPADRNKGVASLMMEHLIKEAKSDQSIHTIVSVITDGNEASLKLHEKFGFEYCGTIKEVGIKFGQYRDIVNYSLSVS